MKVKSCILNIIKLAHIIYTRFLNHTLSLSLVGACLSSFSLRTLLIYKTLVVRRIERKLSDNFESLENV